jgi:hypothetical protein
MTGSPFRVARTLVVVLLALATAFQVVRSAAVTRFTTERPELAARFWPSHPRVELALAMSAIGGAAAKGQAPPAQALAEVADAARSAPLRIEPFRVEGAVALAKADPARAERLFVEAKHRDPRAPAPRFFLAQQYLSTGRSAKGLVEAAVLVRLVGGDSSLVPGLAQFARAPGAIPQLRTLFAANPGLGEQVLAFLARDAANADLVVTLAGEEAVRPAAAGAPTWQAPLIAALLAKEDFARAHALWARIAGLRQPPSGLFNPRFAKLDAPGPFNWTLASGDVGVAEAVAPGGLQILYYGRANADFATQLLLLAPGTYELRMAVARQADTGNPSGLAWSLTCPRGGLDLMKLPLGTAVGPATPLSARFTVPAGCPSHWLKLSGTARDFAASEQAVITDLHLTERAR